MMNQTINAYINAYTELDTLAANAIRMLAVDAVQQANSGHPGLPLGAADIALVLWTRFLKHNPEDPAWINRDRFILSAGHGSALLYALLHLCGYPMPLEEVQRFRQWGSLTPGHPEYDPKRGIETTTGPLGQGFGTAVGIALAERLLAARFNQPGFPVIDHYTYVLASDGDLMEGISHEAASLAGHLGLSRLIVLYDDNHITIDGPTDLTYSEDVLQRFRAYNWHVQQVDGHDMQAIDRALRRAIAEKRRPSLIACRTHIGFKSPLQDNAKVHGAPLGEENLRQTKEAFRWPIEPRFYIPEEVKAYFQPIRQRGRMEQSKWEAMLSRYGKRYPHLMEQWEQFTNGELPAGWENHLPIFTEDKPMATRVASGKVLDAVAPHLPFLIGGSADLTSSVNTMPQGARRITRQDFNGSYVHFGVREHAMAAILNGLALHGLRPYGGTFLVFSDYMRPSIRLSAMMRLPVIYVLTHDSIGLGEDGPTHQPVEQLTSLRAIPNLIVIRPADAHEVVQAWKFALTYKRGPVALILTRQNVPIVTSRDNALEKGAYILKDGKDAHLDLILIATGSEVGLALEAQSQLALEGINARVVSMPSWELFEAQSNDYRFNILPPEIPKLAIEAGVTLAWHRYTCFHSSHSQAGKQTVLGVDRFGASAPYKILFEQYGFTKDNIVKMAKELVGP